MRYILPKGTEISTEILEKILSDTTDIARMDKLENYYIGKTAILSRQMKDKSKPNNKIVNPYANYITNTLTGYFLGEPISYHSSDEDCNAELQYILKYNDVAAVDYSLGKDISIFGKSYELHYIDETGTPRFTKVDARQMRVIYDDSINSEMMYAIRLVPQYSLITDTCFYEIEVYDDVSIKYYRADKNLSNITFIGEEAHYYGMVPIVEYINNENMLGDFEEVMSLIDAYDVLTSDALNDFNYFVDSYLLLRGMTATDEDIEKMKENRVLIVDDSEADAKWLIKTESDTISENMKNRFNDEIHKFSYTPDLSDDFFSGNASGVAIKYKLYGTETLTAVKERYFKKGIQRRLELIFNILNLSFKNYDYLSVDIQFTRNIPSNETEIADIVDKLSGICSTETLLAQIPFIDDIGEEMNRIQKDKEEQPFYDLKIEGAE